MKTKHKVFNFSNNHFYTFLHALILPYFKYILEALNDLLQFQQNWRMN